MRIHGLYNLLIGLTLGVTIILSAPTAISAVSTSWSNLVSPDAEPYTELYFRNIPSLPVKVTARKSVTATFKVVNHENVGKVYPYRVTLVENGHARVLKTGYVTLVPEQSVSIGTAFSAAAPGSSLKFVVDLPNQKQQIHFRSQS